MADLEETILQTSATAELYHTNLLRVQAKELLSESILHLSSHTGELSEEVKWADQVRLYLDSVKEILNGMGPCILSPDAVLLSSSTDEAIQKDSATTAEHARFWIQLQSDLAYKHLQSKDKWEFAFSGGSSLEVQPVFSYAAYGAGLTTKAANAHVIPTIDLAVLMPVRSDGDAENENGFIGDADYVNGRYFDVGLLFFFLFSLLFMDWILTSGSP